MRGRRGDWISSGGWDDDGEIARGKVEDEKRDRRTCRLNRLDSEGLFFSFSFSVGFTCQVCVRACVCRHECSVAS